MTKSLNKQLLFDVMILSLILGLLSSFLVTVFLVSDFDELNPDDFYVFMVFFLILYPFHLLVGFLKYVVARITKNSFPAKFIFFNSIGLLLIGAICFLIKDLTGMYLIISLVFFNITSYVIK